MPVLPAISVEKAPPWADQKLPPFAQVALLAMDEVSKEDADINKVSGLIEADPAFAAELLQIANSALFGWSQRITSVRHGVVTLGLERIRSLCITVGMRAFAKNALRHPILRHCWSHSVATAVLGEELSGIFRINPQTAYAAGLLHDIGRLALIAARPKDYADMLSRYAGKGMNLCDLERRRFKSDHCEAGHWLATQWNFPQEFRAVIKDHHRRSESGLDGGIHFSCVLSDALGYGLANGIDATPLDDVLRSLPRALSTQFTAKWPEISGKIAARIRAAE